MSGVRGDARKRQSQPAPEVGLTEAEMEAVRFCCCHGHLDGLPLAEMAALGAPCPTLAAVARIKADAIQQERERIAQAIDAEMWHFRRVTRADGGSPVVRAYDDAARIAREAGTQ